MQSGSPVTKRAKTEAVAVPMPTTVPALQRRVLGLEAALADSEQKLAGVLAGAAALDCCSDGKCGLGQLVKATTVWEGGTTFRTTAAPEGHELLLEAGKGGGAIAPMQTLLAAAASCSMTGMLTKLQVGMTPPLPTPHTRHRRRPARAANRARLLPHVL